MSENQKPIVTLKTTRFLPQRDGDGNPINEVINVKIEHNTLEWMNYLKNIRHLGFVKPSGKVEVAGATILNDKKERVQVGDDVLKAIAAEVEKAKQDPDKELTPDQKRIAELEAKIEILMRGKGEGAKNELQVKAGEKVGEVVDELLIEARQRYIDIVGKRGGPTWDIETIEQKIKEFQEAK